MILIGLALVAVPLLVAIVRAAIHMDQLAGESETLVVRGMQAARNSQILMDEVINMERRARLYSRLDDPEMLVRFMESYSRFVVTLDRLGELSTDLEASKRLQAMQDDGAVILRTLQNSAPGSDEINRGLGQFAALRERAAALSAINNEIVSRGLSALQDSAQRAQRSLAWQSATLIPVTLALLLLFIFIIGRPIKQIKWKLNTKILMLI